MRVADDVDENIATMSGQSRDQSRDSSRVFPKSADMQPTSVLYYFIPIITSVLALVSKWVMHIATDL